MRGFKALLLLLVPLALAAIVAGAIGLFMFRPSIEYAYGDMVTVGSAQRSFPWALVGVAALAAFTLFAFWRAIYLWLNGFSR